MSLNGLFLSFSGIVRLKNTFFEKKFKNNFQFKIFPIVVPRIFLSLRYGADLGRSRLVLNWFAIVQILFFLLLAKSTLTT